MAEVDFASSIMVWFLRHGETTENRRSIYAGRGGGTLTSAGINQIGSIIRDLSSATSTFRTAVVRSSPQQRALDSAAMIALSLGVAAIDDSDLDEMDFGRWTGLGSASIAKLFPTEWSCWRHFPETTRPGGGETLQEVSHRIANCLSSIDRPCIMVGHETGLRVALCWICGLPLSSFRKWSFPPGTGVLLSQTHGRWSIEHGMGAAVEAE